MTEHLITKPARLGQCSRCAAWILAGHSGGVFVTVEPVPLDQAAELAALLSGRRTYNLMKEAGRLYLEWRCVFHIAASRRHTVVATHPCRGGFVEWTKPDIPKPQPDPDEIPPF